MLNTTSESCVQMQADDKKISDVLTKSFFTIPSYQREYSWQKPQLEKLWEDIKYQFDVELDTISHYLGSLVLKKRETREGLSLFEVIDGQQRLTTYTIFVAACLALLNKYHNNAEYLRVELKNLVFTNPSTIRNYSDADKEKYRKKIELLFADKETYSLIMTLPDRNDPRLKDLNKNLLVKAYTFFHIEIEKFLGSSDVERKSKEAEKRLDRLYTTISENFKVVAITLSKEDNVQRIFETLNNRGKPLEEKDSIKNLLMMNYPGDTEDSSAIYEIYWRDFETSSFWKEPGYGAKDHLSHLLYLYVAQAYPNPKMVEASKLSRKYEEIIKKYLTSNPNEEKYQAFLKDIKESARWYESHQVLDLSTHEGEFLEVAVKSNKSMLIPALWLHKNAEKLEISFEDLTKTRDVLTSWVVLRTIANLSNTKQGIEVGLINSLEKYKSEKDKNSKLKLYEHLSKWIKESKNDFTRLPLLEELERAIVSRIDVPFAKMLLENIEDYENRATLKTPANERTPKVSRNLTVEHLMPQEWEEHWPLVGSPTVEDGLRRGNAVNTIGNLALLDAITNSSIKNSSWKIKVKKLKDYGQSKHTRTVVNNHVDNWDEGTIKKRSLDLLAIILEIWKIK